MISRPLFSPQPQSQSLPHQGPEDSTPYRHGATHSLRSTHLTAAGPDSRHGRRRRRRGHGTGGISMGQRRACAGGPGRAAMPRGRQTPAASLPPPLPSPPSDVAAMKPPAPQVPSGEPLDGVPAAPGAPPARLSGRIRDGKVVKTPVQSCTGTSWMCASLESHQLGVPSDNCSLGP